MPKCRPVMDPAQKEITNYFSVQKGPLKIECKSIFTKADNDRLSKLYRRRSKKHQCNTQDIENDDDDVQYIKTEIPEVSNLENQTIPLSPQIILSTDFGCTKYLSATEMESTYCSWHSNVLETSPSKKQKRETVPLTQLAVTKSRMQAKIIPHKRSLTFQMSETIVDTESDNNDTNYLFAINESTLLNDIGNYLDVKIEEDGSSEIKLPSENKISKAKEDHFDRITNHILLVDDIVRSVIESDLAVLLFDNELNLLKVFQNLTTYEKYLSCKLFTHQVKWYNAYKFAENVKLVMTLFEVKQLVKSLKENLIIKSDYSSESTVSLLHLLNTFDVKAIYDALRLKTKTKKKLCRIDAILNHINSQTTLHPGVSLDRKVRQMVVEKLGDLIHISPLFYTTFYKAHLLYTYTNPEFDIPSGLYRRISERKHGNVLHPDYICRNEIIFENRLEFANFYKAFSYKSEVIRALEKKGDLKFTTMYNLSKEIVEEFTTFMAAYTGTVKDKPQHLQRFTPGHQYASALWILCQHLGAQYPSDVRNWLEILLGQKDFYQKRKGMWYSQLSLVHKAHLKEYDKAVETLLIGLKDKEVSPVDLADLVYRARSYERQKKMTNQVLIDELVVWKELIPCAKSFPSTSITALANNMNDGPNRGDYRYMYPNGDMAYMNVEQIAIRHYIDEKHFTEGIHCEGALAQSIFYILFWDIIYTEDLPYTFVCKMQYLPLDFYSEEFYKNREALINTRLLDIKSNWSEEQLETYIIETWNSVSKYKSLFVLDYIRDGQKLYKIVTCIGRNIISDICRRLVENFRDHRAGMPDLFVYNERKCKFVEVKGPGDKLSTKQKLWINYLLSIGADAEVCYVAKAGKNS